MNPYKSVEPINKFFVQKDTNTPLNLNLNNSNKEVKSLPGLASRCKPDMDWIYNKCMMKSNEYREMLETDVKAAIMINDPLLRKDPYLKAKMKKRILKSHDHIHYIDNNVMNPVFNQCALMYQDLCRNFYENVSLDEKFQME